ncbi:MAG: hypothetical protein ACI915_002231 [Gammaproteobacteria bacterium]|jgi:hypothetical protein
MPLYFGQLFVVSQSSGALRRFDVAPSRILAIGVRLALMCVLISSAQSAPLASEFSISKIYSNGDRFMGVTLRGTVRLSTQKVNGLEPRELSGLAWDADENLLYAVSDEGHLVHLRPIISEQTLIGIELINAFPLRDSAGVSLSENLTDSEGLVARNSRNGVHNDTTLLVSFEEPPRIEHYLPSGTRIGQLELSAELRDERAYAGKNQHLEALTELPEIGIITAPERPLKTAIGGNFWLYNLHGKVGEFSPLDDKYSNLVGMESMQNGDLLILERRYSSIFKPVIFALRRVSLSTHADTLKATVVEEVVHFNISDGWNIDNFEGVARHEGNRYFLISDDNENLFQKTLLMYVEIHSDEMVLPAMQNLSAE